MSVIAEAEELALSLSVSERAKLATKLLASLPSPSCDDKDDGVEEALRRSKEIDENPEMSVSYEDFVKSFEKYDR